MKNWSEIFAIATDDEFEKMALKIFQYQFENCTVYGDFCRILGKTNPENLEEIPFLPISFFKTHSVCHKNLPIEFLFKSSGTTGTERSVHPIQTPEIYEKSFEKTYRNQIGNPENQVIIGLLPHYIEQGESSLVYMVHHLMKKTKNPSSQFVLSEPEKVENLYHIAMSEGKKPIIFGVSYALLDLAEKQIDLSKATIIETGGMKGKRTEMTKEKLHEILKTGLNVPFISSEYGMTELLSQAYSKKNGLFEMPPWMKIKLRETNDPFTPLSKNKTGGINVIDLANVFSCSFIATQDLGRMENNQLQLMGRFDDADIRGCNLLVQ